ncbi:MAG: T9SS type A sorting domain-containing protein [Bacteroidota bacterium]
MLLINAYAANPTSNLLNIQTQSFEKPTLDGNFDVPFTVLALEDLNLNHAFFVEADLPNNWYTGFAMAPGTPPPPSAMDAGDSASGMIRILYNPQNLPFHFQKLKIGVRNLQTQKVESSQFIYVYFTPYNTVEVWSPKEWEMLKREWDSPQSFAPDRQFVPPSSIPNSDLTDMEYAEGTVDIVYKSIPGLAYSIPMKQPPPSNKTELWNTFTGTIKGRILTDADTEDGGSSQIGIAGIRVKLMHHNSLWFDSEIETVYTESNGEFEINYNESAFGQFIKLYLKIETENEGENIRVARLIGTARSEKHFRNNPYQHHWYNSGYKDWGDIVVDNHNTKPQLLHWAVRCQEFVEENATTFSLPTASNHRLVILQPLQNDKAYFLAGGSVVDFLSWYLPTASPGFLLPTAIATSLDAYPDRDYITMGTDHELEENTMLHEYGHYLQWHLQNESWCDHEQYFGRDHFATANNVHPKLTLFEGFASGFAGMVDAFAVADDGEFQAWRGSWNIETRKAQGGKPENHASTVVKNGMTHLATQVVTHGYVAEWNVAAALYDLWDGPSNLPTEGFSSPFSTSFYADDGNDAIQLSFETIIQPFLDHQGTGGLLSQDAHLLLDFTDYKDALMSLLSCEEKHAVADLMEYNGLMNLDIPSHTLTEYLERQEINTDSIYYTDDVVWDHYRQNPWASGFIFLDEGTHSFDFDVISLPNDHSGFNFTPNVDASGVLTDDLHMTGDGAYPQGVLFFNADRPSGWQTNANVYGETAGTAGTPAGTFNVSLCGGVVIEADNGGGVEVGGQDGRFAEVRLESGGKLILGGGFDPSSPYTDTIWNQPVSIGRLTVHNHSKFIVEEGAELHIERGAEIVLDGPEAILEIYGDIHIADSADFTFSGQGHIYLDLPDRGGAHNVFTGKRSNIRFKGADISDTTFVMAEGSYFKPDPDSPFLEFDIRDGFGHIGGGGYIDVAASKFSMENQHITSDNLQYEGIRLNGEFNVFRNVILEEGNPAILAEPTIGTIHEPVWIEGASIQNCTDGILIHHGLPGNLKDVDFLNMTNTGLSAAQTMLSLENCDFMTGTIGLATQECVVDLIDCDFAFQTTGWDCSNPTGNCSVSGGGASLNSERGYVIGGSNVSISLDDVSASNNGISGLRATGAMNIEMACSNFENNTDYGVRVGMMGVLDMEDYAYNVIRNNGDNIALFWADRPLLDNGNNDLTAASGSYALTGTIAADQCSCTAYAGGSCTTYELDKDNSIDAYDNTWNAAYAAPSSSTVNLTDVSTNCNYVINDDAGGAVYDCANPFNRMAGPQGATTADPLFARGRVLDQGRFSGQRLGLAVQTLLQRQNAAASLSDWYDLLMLPLSHLNTDEQQLIQHAYQGMRAAFAAQATVGEVDFDHLANAAQLDPRAHLVMEVIDHQIAQFEPNPAFLRRLEADRAQLLTHVGRTTEALAAYSRAMRDAEGEWANYLTEMACQARAKDMYLRGTLDFKAYMARLRDCAQNARTTSAESAAETAQPDAFALHISPNPSQGTVRLDLEGVEGAYSISVLNLKGQIIFQTDGNAHNHSKHHQSLDLGAVADGMYLIRFHAGARMVTRRLLIQH